VRRAGVDAILKMVELSAAVRHGLLDDETGDLEYTGGNTIKLPVSNAAAVVVVGCCCSRVLLRVVVQQLFVVVVVFC